MLMTVIVMLQLRVAQTFVAVAIDIENLWLSCSII